MTFDQKAEGQGASHGGLREKNGPGHMSSFQKPRAREGRTVIQGD